MSKHKGAEQRGKAGQPEQGQGSAHENQPRKPHDGGAQGKTNQHEHQQQTGGHRPGEHHK